MRFLLAAIGYAATATVLATVLGLGYLWQSEMLTDERVFRIVALLQGVEIDQSGGEPDRSDPSLETPGEESSLVEQERVRAIALRSDEARLVALERGQAEFEHSLGQLVGERKRFDEMATELNQRLEQESNDALEDGVQAVVRDLRLAKPDKGKELLLKLLERGGSDPLAKDAALQEVIRLINAMPQGTWENILKRFEGEQELEQLHQIQVEQLKGGPKQSVLAEALGIVNQDTQP